ncbi:hypothetical protein HPB51_009099 [Rhipicephalus microplus]|uniref:G-protein coupled receptors family 1 profile domain-containing protein n=1 Tax=Rhipicephalus microplus TaxID=6941 RepID=A0A9J6EZN1_RHIMP|nr:hypothetical protein HPB51_009099 [Rhipicephalus microplus]
MTFWQAPPVVYTSVEASVAFLATIGNLAVLVCFARERRLRRRLTNYYILSLAVADLLVGVLAIPFAVLTRAGIPHDSPLACVAMLSFIVVLCTVSILHLVAVSVDRYWAILYPLAYQRLASESVVLSVVIACWLSGFVLGFLPLLGWHDSEAASTGDCLFLPVMKYSFLVFLYFATIVYPALLIAFFYIRIYSVVRKQSILQDPLLLTRLKWSEIVDVLCLEVLGETRRDPISMRGLLDIDAIDSGVFRTYFRLEKDDVPRLQRALCIPDKVTTPQRVSVPGDEALCITLRRLAYPNRLRDLEHLFARHSSTISSLTNEVFRHIEDNFFHLLDDEAFDATTAGDATPRPLEAAILNNYARSPGRRCAVRWDDETSGRARSAVKPLAASAYWRMRGGVSAGPLRSAGRWPALLKLSNERRASL